MFGGPLAGLTLSIPGWQLVLYGLNQQYPPRGLGVDDADHDEQHDHEYRAGWDERGSSSSLF